MFINEIVEKGNSKGTEGYMESIGGRKHSLYCIYITAVLTGRYSYIKVMGKCPLKMFRQMSNKYVK